ncbi:MAG: cobalt transporter CbiM [Terriglobales bacterium]
MLQLKLASRRIRSAAVHIPDGYLSPATCAALYGGAIPFWYASLRRLRQRLNTRLVPLLSLFAAFAFVVMLFNLPLPGGTTGHAVGVAVAAIVLGPSASILAISTAILIQALFFGDGGLTTLGANCFNMAIVGSLVAYGVYHAIAGRSLLTSRRRVIAAAVAGYAAINAAALCTALELGIQPIFYHDAAGAPLYAPYPLRIAIPAMMIGHLTIAGLAELVLSGGMLAYLQRSNPEILLFARDKKAPILRSGQNDGLRSTKPLWVGLAMALLLTPLGVLAVGSAWGEWSARDFAHAETREQIATASLNHAPPSQVPQGLDKLTTFWTAPFPSYSVPFVHSQFVGCVLSAMFGTGMIILLTLALRIHGRIFPGSSVTPPRETHGR